MIENAPAEPAVDVRRLVAEIEAEVARRRAAGEYPEELLARLRTEFRVVGEEKSLDELAHIETVRTLESQRPGLGRLVVFAKRVLRRLVAWYVRPIAEDQSRFNYALLRQVAALEKRLARVETAWQRAPGAPPRTATPTARAEGLEEARLQAIRDALRDRPPGPVAVIAFGDAGAVQRLQAEGVPVEAVTPDAALAAAVRAAGVRCHQAEPLAWLESTGPSLAAVVGLGLLPLLSPAETLRVVPLIAQTLRPAGRVLLDAPDPRYADAPRDVAGIDPAMRRWIGPDTALLLCEAAGLAEVTVHPVGIPHGSGSAPWYAVTGQLSATGGAA
jgi:hypothetical protein